MIRILLALNLPELYIERDDSSNLVPVHIEFKVNFGFNYISKTIATYRSHFYIGRH